MGGVTATMDEIKAIFFFFLRHVHLRGEGDEINANSKLY
jgi:hypothetical protein